MAHDRLGEAARRVMAASTAPLVGRLQDRRAGADLVLLRRAALVDDRVERRGQVGDGAAASTALATFADS